MPRCWPSLVVGVVLLAPFPGRLAGDDATPHKEDGVFQHLKFRLVGPAAGGRVSRACGVAGDPMVYYLGAASGGVWKTTDGGFNWKPIFDDQPTSSIGAIAVAPSEPSIVYVGSGEANIRGNVAPGNGIYKSSDGGKTWKHLWKFKGQVSHIVVHPRNADIAYAAVLGSAFSFNGPRGIFRTVDGGKTWGEVLANAPAGGIDVALDPANPRVLYAALWEAQRTPWSLTSGGKSSGLYRTDDGGDTWKKLGPTKFDPEAREKDKKVDDKKVDDKEAEDNGLPAGVWGRVGIAVAPSNPERVYALIEADKGGLYRSDDGGKTWELVNGHRYLQQRPWYFSVIRVDPHNADVVYACSVRLLKSTDAGKSFKNLKGPHHVDHHDLWIDPANPRRMIDSNDGGVDITANGGATWHAPMLPISQFYHISCDNSVPYRIMGNMQDLGTASGPSHSLRGGGIMLSDWHTVGGGETGFSVADPGDPNIIYAGEYMGIITRYDHRTRQARNVSVYPITGSGKGAEDLKYRFQWTAPILISPHDNKTIYHAANVLFRTRDAGKSWDKISPDLTRDDRTKQKWSGGPITGDNTGAEVYCTIFAIAESPARKGVLWAGSDDGLVHVSVDDGKSWSRVTPPGLPEWGTVACIEPGRRDAGIAYVVVDAHRLDDNRPYLWKTSDYGKTWTNLTKGLPDDHYLRVVREDSIVPGMLYLGSEHGLYFSWDDGATWRKLRMGLPTVAVSDLVVKDGDLVVGTSGRSIWILDDLTPLRAWSQKLKETPHLFATAPATRWRLGDDGYAPDDRIAGANPPTGAMIHYHLPARPKEDLVLEIVDKHGVVVQTLTSRKYEPAEKEDDPDAPWSIFKPATLPKEPGIQRVVWDLRSKGPTVIPGAKNDWGVPHKGFLMPPGPYALRLRVDGETLTGKVDVRIDPRMAETKETTAALAENHAFCAQVRDEITRLSTIVLGLQEVRRQIQEQRQTWGKDGKLADLVRRGDKLIAGLDALEGELHNPKAEVAYDILARKGGARLYSQLSALYAFATESDGDVTQGMRETLDAWAAELRSLEGRWRSSVDEVHALNAELHRRGVRHVTVPATK